MDDRSIQNKIKEIIHKRNPNAEAYLFGSRARGNYQHSSDWDILILINAPKVTNDIEDNFRDELYELELETGQIISTFIYPKNYWENALLHTPLYSNIKKEGIRL